MSTRAQRLAGVMACFMALPAMAAASAAAQGKQVLELRVINGALPQAQRLIQVHQGAKLRWRITSNAAGELHLHAYRLSVALQPGQVAELAFTAFASGRFRVEWHRAPDPAAAPTAPSALNAPSAPNAPNAHPAPALAVLEVWPN